MFFTIKDVLAKHDALAAGEVSARKLLRLASIEPIANDPPTLRAPAGNPSPARPAASDEPFGMTTFRAPEGLLWTKWRKLNADLRADQAVESQCRTNLAKCSSPAARSFNSLVDQARRLVGTAKIEFVNRQINGAVRYTSDLDQHGEADRWSSPLATLASGRGDCEDYAIAKYVALREAGVGVDDLRIALMRNRINGQDHAVAAVREGTRWLLLDNRHSGLTDSLRLSGYTPLFALDRNGVALFAAPYVIRTARASAISARISASGTGSDAETKVIKTAPRFRPRAKLGLRRTH